MGARHGRFVAMDPLEWLARMSDHIPDQGKHRTLLYGHYANRARGARDKEKALLEVAQAEAPKKRRCSPSWARLISKVYHVDLSADRQARSPAANAAVGSRSSPTSTSRPPFARSSTISASVRPRSSGRHLRSATSLWTTRAGRSASRPGLPKGPERTTARLTALPVGR